MKPISFACFSDIHYAEYSTGITVDDVVRVERTFTDLAYARQVDFCLFTGDRFLSHTPDAWVMRRADAEQRHRNDLGLVTFSLLGNHDWHQKTAVAGHTNDYAKLLYKDIHTNLVVMDEPGSYEHPNVPNVRIHALPAGSSFDWKYFNLGDGYNILVFHDMLAGCMLDHRSEYVAPKGMSQNDLDHIQLDCVLGGDIHIPQRIDFKHTQGGYVGSCIQQSRRDRGNPRGYLICHLQDGKFKTEHVPSPCPHFLDAHWDLEEHGHYPTADDIKAIVKAEYDDDPNDNIIDLVFSGTRAAHEAQPKGYLTDLKAALGARRVNPPKRVLVGTAMLPQQGPPKALSAEAPAEAFITYLKGAHAPLEGLNAERLMAKAMPVLYGLNEGT